jgi:lipase ATG15
VYGQVPFWLGFVLVTGLSMVAGLTVREKLRGVLGTAFVATLGFFCALSVLLLLVAVANVQPHADLTVTGGQPVPVVPNGGLRPVYAVCQRAWSGLDVLDLGLLSKLAYASSDEEWRLQMRGAFGNTSAHEYRVVREQGAHDQVIAWKAIEFGPAQGNMTVVAVRGTSTAPEAYEDLYLFGAVGLFQLADTIFPISRSLPDNMLTHLFGAMALPGVSAPPVWHPLLDALEDLKGEGRRLLVTGHSLGGALAAALGARLGLEAVVFSSPGLYYNQRRFGFTEESLMLHTLNVVPENDLVPAVDQQKGAVQHIRCHHSAPTCHALQVTLCTLHTVCGDQRKRVWSDYCRDYS